MSFASVAVELLLVVLVILLLVLLGCVLAQCRLGKLGGAPLPAMPALRREAKQIRGGGTGECTNAKCDNCYGFFEDTDHKGFCVCSHPQDDHADDIKWAEEIGSADKNEWGLPVEATAPGSTWSVESLRIDPRAKVEGDAIDGLTQYVLPKEFRQWNGAALAAVFNTDRAQQALVVECRTDDDIAKAFIRARALFIAEVLPKFGNPAEIVDVLKKIVAQKIIRPGGEEIANGGLNKAVAVFRSFDADLSMKVLAVDKPFWELMTKETRTLTPGWIELSDAQLVDLCMAHSITTVVSEFVKNGMTPEQRANIYTKFKVENAAQALLYEKDMLKVAACMPVPTLREIIRDELIDLENRQAIVCQMKDDDAMAAVFPLTGDKDPVIKMLVCNDRLIDMVAKALTAGRADALTTLNLMVTTEQTEYKRISAVVPELLTKLAGDKRNECVKALKGLLSHTYAACQLEIMRQPPLTMLSTLAQQETEVLADPNLTSATIATVMVSCIAHLFQLRELAKTESPAVFNAEFELWIPFIQKCKTDPVMKEAMKEAMESKKPWRCFFAIMPIFREYLQNTLTALYYMRGSQNQLVMCEEDGIIARKAIIIGRRIMIETHNRDHCELYISHLFSQTIMRASMRATQICMDFKKDKLDTKPIAEYTSDDELKLKKWQFRVSNPKLTFMCSLAGELVNADSEAPDCKTVGYEVLREKKYFAEGAMTLYSPCMPARIAAVLLRPLTVEELFKTVWQINLIGIHLGGLTYNDFEGNPRRLVPKSQRIKAASIVTEMLLDTDITDLSVVPPIVKMFNLYEPGLDPLGGYTPFFFSKGDYLAEKLHLLLRISPEKRVAILGAIMVAPVAGSDDAKDRIAAGTLSAKEFAPGMKNLAALFNAVDLDADDLCSSLAVELIDRQPAVNREERLCAMLDALTDDKVELDLLAAKVLETAFGTDPNLLNNVSLSAFQTAYVRASPPVQNSICASHLFVKLLPEQKGKYINSLPGPFLQALSIEHVYDYLKTIEKKQVALEFIRKLSSDQVGRIRENYPDYRFVKLLPKP